MGGSLARSTTRRLRQRSTPSLSRLQATCAAACGTGATASVRSTGTSRRSAISTAPTPHAPLGFRGVLTRALRPSLRTHRAWPFHLQRLLHEHDETASPLIVRARELEGSLCKSG